MAEKLAQFKDDFPILNVQPVASRAKGYQVAEKVADATSKVIFQAGASLQKEASSAMLLQSQSALADVQSKTQISLLQGNADPKTIADQAINEVNAIKSSAALNASDRKMLDYYSDRSINAINLYAQKQITITSRQNAKTAFLGAWSNNTENLTKALLNKDPKVAEDLIKKMTESVAGMVKLNALTLQQGSRLLDSIKETQYRVGATLRNYDNMDAAGYHAIKSGMTNSSLNADEEPTNQTTQSIYDITSSNLLMSDLRAALDQGKTIAPQVLIDIKERKQFEFMNNYAYGSMLGNGQIYSGQSYPHIDKEIKRLSDIGNRGTIQEGFYNRLRQYRNDIKNGEFLRYASETKEGAAAIKAFNGERVAVEALKDGITDEEKQSRLRNASTKYTDAMMNVAESLQIPLEYRSIFSQQIVDDVKYNMFDPDGNIAEGVKSIAGLKDNSLPYFANQMKSPKYNLVTNLVGKLYNKADTGFMQDFIMSARDGHDYTNLKMGEDGTSKDKIKDLLNSGLSEVSTYISSLPGGTDIVGNLTDRGIDYVKYRAAKANDPTFSNLKTYTNDFNSNVSRAYNIHSSFMGQIDLNVIPVDDKEADQLQSLALNETYRKMHEYMSYAEFNTAISQNPPRVISLPSGHIVVVDQTYKAIPDKNGNAAFDELFNLNMLKVAKGSKVLGRNRDVVQNYFLGRDVP